jgi:hypothetical protein
MEPFFVNVFLYNFSRKYAVFQAAQPLVTERRFNPYILLEICVTRCVQDAMRRHPRPSAAQAYTCSNARTPPTAGTCRASFRGSARDFCAAARINRARASLAAACMRPQPSGSAPNRHPARVKLRFALLRVRAHHIIFGNTIFFVALIIANLCDARDRNGISHIHQTDA